MQRLAVVKKNPDGSESEMYVNVIRSWSLFPNLAVYLHQGGIYGYRDGAPIRTKEELENAITDPVQQEAALRWWESEGEKLAKDFYSGEERPKTRTIYYARLPKDKPRPKKLPKGLTFDSLGFGSKPDWWGEAEEIVLGNWVYVLEPEPVVEEAGKVVEADEL